MGLLIDNIAIALVVLSLILAIMIISLIGNKKVCQIPQKYTKMEILAINTKGKYRITTRNKIRVQMSINYNIIP